MKSRPSILLVNLKQKKAYVIYCPRVSLTTTNHNYDVDARAYTSGQIITVAAAVYHGEDSIVFCIVCF